MGNCKVPLAMGKPTGKHRVEREVAIRKLKGPASGYYCKQLINS